MDLSRFLVRSIYIALPLLLWPLTFIVFRDRFIYLMAISTTVLGFFSLALYRRSIPLTPRSMDLAVGIIGAVALYVLFYAGDILLRAIGLDSSVDEVYAMITEVADMQTVALALIWIGAMEELYWRGGLLYGALSSRENIGGENGENLVDGRSSVGAFIAASYYTLVHLSTMNVALIAGALVAGVVLTVIAYYRGVAASIIAHIIWLELLIVILPLR